MQNTTKQQTQTFSIRLSPENHRALKVLAAKRGVSIGEAVSFLLRSYRGMPEPTPARFEWTRELVAAVEAGADPDEWIAANPAPAEPDKIEI